MLLRRNEVKYMLLRVVRPDGWDGWAGRELVCACQLTRYGVWRSCSCERLWCRGV